MQKLNKQQIIAKIEFLEEKLNNLDDFLPETYEFLRHQIDCQKRILMEFEIIESFKLIDIQQKG